MRREVVVAERRYVESMARIRFDRPGELLDGGSQPWLKAWAAGFVKTPVGLAVSTAVVLGGRRCGALEAPTERPDALLGHLSHRHAGSGVPVRNRAPSAVRVRISRGGRDANGLTIHGMLCGAHYTTVVYPAVRRHGMALAAAVFAVSILFTVPRPAPGDALGSGIFFSDYYYTLIDRLRRGKVSRDVLVQQRPYPEVALVRLAVGELNVYRPVTGPHCWDAPLPCTPYLDRRIEARGPSLADGFRAVPGSVETFDGQRLAWEWRHHQAGGIP